VHAQIALPEGTKREWTTHSEVDEDYCRQIVAEELVVKPSGKRVWICPNHRANHYFDCEVLARAAAMSRQVHALPQLRAEIHVTQPEKPKPTFIQPAPRPGGWFKR
jgi:phage terminase large subunit GpA-like protein